MQVQYKEQKFFRCIPCDYDRNEEINELINFIKPIADSYNKNTQEAARSALLELLKRFKKPKTDKKYVFFLVTF